MVKLFEAEILTELPERPLLQTTSPAQLLAEI